MISILLPVRNGGVYFRAALDSLAEQTYADFEVVVQDDGSTDDSAGVARSYGERFRVETQAPGGIVAGLNAAAARARGGLFVRMDADDVCAPTRLEQLVDAAATHPDVGLFGHRVRYFPEEHVRSGMRHYEQWVNSQLTHEAIYRDRFVECPIVHATWAIRRATFEALGGYDDGLFPEDYDFFLRAADAGARFLKLSDVLLDVRESGQGFSKAHERYSPNAFRTLKMRHLVPHLQARAQPLAIVGAGPDGKRWAKDLIAAGLEVRHFVEVHPRRIGQVIHGADVIGYEDLERAADCFVLAAVGQKGARDEVRGLLTAAGREEETSFLCVQ